MSIDEEAVWVIAPDMVELLSTSNLPNAKATGPLIVFVPVMFNTLEPVSYTHLTLPTTPYV